MNFSQQLDAGIFHLQKSDPILARLIKKYGRCELSPHTDYYGELLSSIVGQQLSVKAAATIWKRVLAVYANKLPTPKKILDTDVELLRSCGVSYSKINYMRDLAEHINDGRLDLSNLAALTNKEITTQLVVVKGIGEWSAHMFMIFCLGKLDVLPVGDLGIRKGIALNYEVPELPDAQAVKAIAITNKWQPYQSIAAWYIWKSLDNNNA